jgi:hypothetical protein
VLGQFVVDKRANQRCADNIEPGYTVSDWSTQTFAGRLIAGNTVKDQQQFPHIALCWKTASR